MPEMRNSYILVINPEWNTSPWRLRRRLENNIKMGFRETRYDDVNWIHRDQRRALVNKLMNFRSP
jgi:hypothetical protein